MGSLKKTPSEGGSGGRRGHSSMEHWDYTAAIKDAARRRRREDDSTLSRESLLDNTPLAELTVTESFSISGRGTGVLFSGSNGEVRFGQLLDIDVLRPDAEPRAASASVEAVRRSDGERPALLVMDLEPADLPVGALIIVWAAG